MPLPSASLLPGATLSPGSDLDPLRPTVDEIGTLLHDRTTTDGGDEAGTFLNANDDGGPTDPTASQVDRMITIAMQQIAIQLPDELTDKQTSYARTMVAYLAAIIVENSHFSDQVQAGNSLASLYQSFLDTGMLTLTGSIGGGTPGGPGAFSIGTPTVTQDLIASSRAGLYCNPYRDCF